VRGTGLQWFKSYLTNRKQYVCVNNAVNSKTNEIICGVPQGSILGPLLFLIYINDIVKISPILNMILFADDTNLFISGKNLTETVTKLNQELCKLSNWFKVNKLSLNVKKTNYIIFRNKSKKIEKIPEIIIDNCKINPVTSCKFLGVIINENLSWADHIETIRKKISKNIGLIKHIKHQLSVDVLRSLYFALVSPYLEYCNMVWAIGSNTALNQLFITQKRAIRVISNSRWNAHTAPLFKNLKILTILELNKLQIACFMYRVNRNLVPSFFVDMFCLNSNVHSHSTRQANNYHIRLCRTTLFKNTLRNTGAVIWNSLDANIRTVPTLSAFRNHYKSLLLNNSN